MPTPSVDHHHPGMTLTTADDRSRSLLESARALEAVARDVPPAAVPGVLANLEAALDSLATSAEAMAGAVVPPGGAICDRYRAAAAAFPEGARPPNERLALLLAALHDAAASLRTAADQCGVALDATRPLAAASR